MLLFFFYGGCIFILITLIFLYNAVSLRENTENSASDEDDGEQEEPGPAVSSTAFALPRDTFSLSECVRNYVSE